MKRRTWFGPWWVVVALYLARSFGQRRRVFRAWTWWDCSPTRCAVSNAWFKVRHPVLTWQVHRLRQVWRDGDDILQA